MISEWIDITTCEDGADRVLAHEKTGQRKIVKPAERTILDDAYDDFWNSTRSRPDPTDLLAVVRAFTMKAAKHDEDIAQGVAMIVFEGLETFSRADATAFTRWVRSIVKRVRLEHYRTSSDHTDEFKEAAMGPPSEEAYADVSELPDELKRIAALIIEGYSLSEIAFDQNVTSATLRKRLQRYRKNMSRN